MIHYPAKLASVLFLVKIMSEKSKVLYSTVNGNSVDTFDFPIIPNGEHWCLLSFGACDINLGDNKSSVYSLLWDNEPIRGGIISLTGSTYEIQINKEIIGDGIKTLKIRRENKSNSAKQLPCWIVAVKKC